MPFALFLAIFSLDIFDGTSGFWAILLGLFMHNLPSLVLLIILIISWKYEFINFSHSIINGLRYFIMIANAGIVGYVHKVTNF